MSRSSYAAVAILALIAACAPPPAPGSEGLWPDPAIEDATPPDTPASVAPLAGLATASSAVFTHEPTGFTPLIELSFSATKLPRGVVVGPNATYGVVRGKVTSAEAAAQVAPGVTGAAGDYARRCLFPANTQVQGGKGVGCTFTAKENLPGNTDGNTVHSYRLWYERGYFRFGNLDAAGNILPVFEEPSPGGMKLLGYWGVGYTGNANPLQLIGWWAPIPRGSAGYGKAISTWTFQLSSQNTGVLVWDKYSSVPVAAGAQWHAYELLFDAGDVDGNNGTAQVWIDGRQVLSATKLAFRSAKQAKGKPLTHGWTGRHWNPVQGGGCGTQPICGRVARGVLDIDEVYVSVSQPVD